MCLPAREYTDTRVRPGGEWVSAVVADPSPEGTATRLVMWRVGNPEHSVVLMRDCTVGRGLSGGVHAWTPDGAAVYVATHERGILAVGVNGDQVVSVDRTAFGAARSWSTPAVSADGSAVCAVADWREVWVLGRADGALRCVHTAEAFAIDCTFGDDVRFHTWDRPNMPWTQSRIHPDSDTEGRAVQQPQFSRDGRSFGFIDDSRGMNNVRIVADTIVATDTVIDDDVEHGGPTWGPGQRTWCFNSDATKVAYTRNEDGYGSLWVYDRLTLGRHMVARAVHGCLSWEGDTLAAVRSGARTPQQVVIYDMSDVASPVRTVVATGGHADWSLPAIADELLEPTVHVCTNSPRPVVYRLYRPERFTDRLILMVHGGPTDQWQVTFRPRISFWNSRGWAVAVVDQAGSSGHGRAYVTFLHRMWGSWDSTTTWSVLQDLHVDHGFAPERTVLMGGSAGGLTAANVAGANDDMVARLVLQYPVVDLGDLLAGDDPFETHYMPTLLGTDDATELAKRSPVRWAQGLAKVPTLIFHGDRDTSVPLSHSEKLRDAVVGAGGEVRLEVMVGEGHGFRDPANILRELEITESFLDGL